MPKIPTYDNPTIQADPMRVVTGQPVSADTFGAGLAKGMQQLGHAATSIAVAEQGKQDLAIRQEGMTFADKLVKDADVAIKSSRSTDAFGSDDDPIGITDKRLTIFKDEMDKFIKEKVKTGQQEEFITNLSQQRLNAIEHGGLLHEIDQRDKHQEGVYKSSVASAFDRMALYATDPNSQHLYKEAFDEAVSSTDAFGKSRNWSSEQQKVATDDVQSKAAKLKATQMMTLNPVAAKEFIEANKEFLGSDYTILKHSADLVSADQEGVNYAVGVSSRLKTEEYTTLRDEGFKHFGGGTGKFNQKAFKVFEAQLASDNQAIKIEQTQRIESMTGPLYAKIIDAEKDGGKLSPKTLFAMPEYQALYKSGDSAVLKKASELMDKVFSEHHAVVAEQRAETRFNKQIAVAGAGAKRESQRNAWMEYYANPDKVASMSKAEMLETAHSLGAYGDDLIKMHSKATSPEALAEVKVESSIFKSTMEVLKVPKDKQGQVQEAMKSYLITEQQDQKRKMNSNQIRAAIAAGISEVSVNEKVSFLGIDMGETTTTKKLYEVKNQKAIIIPDKIVPQITEVLKSAGISDTPKNRLEIYKAIKMEEGGNKLRGLK